MQVIGKGVFVAFAVMSFGKLCESQQAGHFEEEQGPLITVKQCTLAGGCTSSQKKVTLDANWRWIHKTSGYDNCYTGNAWDKSVCNQDGASCAQNCAVEGIPLQKYEDTYGVSQVDGGVKLKFVTEHQHGVNVGSRLYVLDDDNRYFMWQLKNREFALDIDVSGLFCGMNGAMYFVEMDEKGGHGLGNNQAGAKYGTGYCDAQCPHDIKFINGEANCVDWRANPRDEDNNMGIGKYGSCCAEMDIWEANSMATAYTPHPCELGGDLPRPAQFKCEGTDCGDNDKDERYQGVCDKDGCDINPFRMGNTTFYGRGPEYAINTLRPMTVVTQFITSDNTDNGDLVEIRRFYRQDGKIVHSPPTKILGSKATDSITDQFCVDKKELFEDVNDFMAKGGNRAMGESLDRGQVLALSLWDDVEVNMLWLDSAYPLDKDSNQPGVLRGDCPGGEQSKPTYVRGQYPDAYVTFANAAIGEIGSTLIGSTGPFPTTPPPPCVERCSPAPGQNTPECNGQTKARCQQMVQYENKCQWTECQGSTPVPSTSSPTSTPSTTAAPPPTTPEPEPSCLALEAQIEECVQQGNVFECQHCASADVGNRCCSCQGSSTSTATLPGTVTETTTTSPALPGQCKAWCASNGKSWEKKCKWTGCAGCPSCNTRRLGASNRLLV